MSGKRGLRIAALLVVLAVVSYALGRSRAQRTDAAAPPPPPETVSRAAPPATDPALLAAIERHRSDVWGVAAGTVERLLEDDRKGIPHQQFIIRIETGATILIEYNLDLAPRITPLEVGDSVVVRGEYHWSELGGRIHWVHHDPSGGPGGGWLKVRGKVYQ
jgi:hypothetical protein